jgi:AGZA family xanthine/uracil permease-like MFS transporter
VPDRPPLRTEVLAGVTTFVTMAYIVFVQPAVLGAAGMDPGAVFMATCLASAIATALMGWLANYPIAVAPAMGHNFFFAYTVVLAGGTPWRVARQGPWRSRHAFIAAGFGLRERIIRALPGSFTTRSASASGCSSRVGWRVRSSTRRNARRSAA